MEIRWQTRKGRVFVLIFGRHTKWHDSMKPLYFIEEFYENRQIVYANFIFSLGKEKI